MERARVSVWTYLVLVFAGGLATGFFADRVYSMRTVSAQASPRNPEEWKRQYLADIRTHCHLTDAQVAQVTEILGRTRERADALRSRMAPEWEALHAEQVKRVGELMTGSQIAEYTQFRAERDARHKAHSRP